ncbi:MAG TPA: PAS domain-containing protein [Trichormus sp. M33_DOE_039]|nr:PAS domain-containing protein [Trichormus sp. M33_DOE_039]
MPARQSNWGRLLSRHISLQTVLIGSVVLQILAVTGLTGYFSFRHRQNAIHDLTVQLRNQASKEIRDQLNSYLAAPHQLNQIKANAIRLNHVNTEDFDRLHPYLIAQLQVFHSVTNTGIATPSGNYISVGRQIDGSFSNPVIDRSQGKFLRYELDQAGNRTGVLQVAPYRDPRLDDWYRYAIKAGKPTWSQIFPWTFKEFGIGLMAAQPVYDATGKQVGVVNSGLILDHISKFLQKLEVTKLGKVFVVEGSGLLVATSTQESPIRRLGNQNTAERVSSLESQDALIRLTTQHLLNRFGNLSQIQHPQQIEFTLAGKRQFIQLTPIVDPRGINWLAVIVIPESAFAEQMNANTNATLWLCLVALLLSAGLGFLTARWLAMPIHRLSQAAKFIAEGNFDYRVEQQQSIQEINALAQSFNQMAQQLQVSFAKLHQSEEKFRQMAENIQEVFWLADIEINQMLYVSPVYEQIWGRSCESLYEHPRSFIDAIHPSDRQRVINHLNNTNTPFAIEYRVVQPDGKIRWVYDRGFPVVDATGKVIRRAGVAQDITERKMSEARFRNLATNVPGVIYRYVLHPDGSDEVLYVSPGCQSLWEIDAAEIERNISLIWNLVHPDDELAMRASILTSAQSLQPWLQEWRIITPSGLLKWVRGAAQPEPQANGDVIWDGLLMDISDRKSVESILQQQVRQAQALNRVVQSIRNSLDLPTIFSTTMAEVTQLLGVNRTTIVQYFPHRSCWRVVACHRIDESLPDITGFEIPDEGNSYAAQIKQFQIVRVDDMEQVNDPVNQEIAKNFRSIWLIIPIVLKGKIWGSLSLANPQDKAPWKDEEVELARQVADQLAIAIQQAQLYQQAQQELSYRQQAEAALQQLNQELEQRVQERTKQLRQEVQIRQQAEIKFQQIFHISPHAIAIASLQDRRIIDLNEAFSQLFGYSRVEMVGRHTDEFQMFINPADQGIVQRYLLELGSVRNLECIIRTKTGEARTAIASAEFIDIDDLPCFLVIGNDITDRKQAEEALVQSEARFQKIAAASPAQIHILVTHSDGSLIRFEYVSPAVWDLREVSPVQLLQDPAPIYDQIHPDDRAGYFAARDHSLETMTPLFHEYRIVTLSGQVKWVRVNSRPERRENNEIFWYGIVLDVSDRKQIESQLRESLQEKEVLLREVYHRVKNNMQLVSSLLRLQANTTEDPAILRLLNESQQRVKTMALIHERLYRSHNLARIHVTTYIQDLVNNLVRSYSTADESIRVTLDLADLELDLDTAVPCGLIINELISNAFKYAFPNQQGEITLRFSLEDTSNYCLMIKDDGVGIPAHIDPQRTDSLGMQLVYGLTQQLRGKIELDRQEGSQFKITFKKRL